MVAEVGTEEALEAVRHLLGAVGMEWLGALVVDAPTPFLVQASAMQPVVGHPLGEAPSLSAKLLQA